MDSLEASRYGERLSRFHHRPPSWKKIRSKFFKFQKSSSRFNRTRVSRLAINLVNQCHLDSSLELFLFMVNTSSIINEQVYSQTNPNDGDKLMVTQRHGFFSIAAFNFENFPGQHFQSLSFFENDYIFLNFAILSEKLYRR